MNQLTSILKKTLFAELKILKAYGVDQIGYRYYLKDGRSFGIPTSVLWDGRNKDNSFNKTMECFLSPELLKLKMHNHHYVSRSDDHQHSEYIEYLNKMQMGNSVGFYQFTNTRIDSL